MLSKDEVKNIALLARIGLADDEVAQYQKELSSVLDFFHTLQAVPTEAREPIGHITGMTDVARQDHVEEFGQSGTESIQKNFPDSKDGFLKVKSVF